MRDKEWINRQIRKIREAYNRGDIISIEINNDASGGYFHFYDPHGDHGMRCDVAISLDIDDTIKAIAGMRLGNPNILKTLKISKYE